MKKRSVVYQLTTCALMAALMCVLGPMSIQVGPIPVSFTNLAIYLAVYLLGMKGATVSYILYLLLGAAGMPVFSGFAGGLGKLAGPTGGYLIGFLFMALIAGDFVERSHGNGFLMALGMYGATLVAYLFGTMWFVAEMHCTVWYALTVCVFPFLLIDLAKVLIVTALGKPIRRALIKSNLLWTKK